jgi:hypothetical protein
VNGQRFWSGSLSILSPASLGGEGAFPHKPKRGTCAYFSFRARF